MLKATVTNTRTNLVKVLLAFSLFHNARRKTTKQTRGELLTHELSTVRPTLINYASIFCSCLYFLSETYHFIPLILILQLNSSYNI